MIINVNNTYTPINAINKPSEGAKEYNPSLNQNNNGQLSRQDNKGLIKSNIDRIKEERNFRIQQEIARLKARESEVIAHEAAHKAVGGSLTGPASYTYQRGPDGKNYIVGGEVPIDISPGRTPEETIRKMQQVRAAALAPANPSPQDYKVAAIATQIEMSARAELAKKESENLDKNTLNLNFSQSNTNNDNKNNNYGIKQYKSVQNIFQSSKLFSIIV